MGKQIAEDDAAVTAQVERIVWVTFAALPDMAAIDRVHEKLLERVARIRKGDAVSLDDLLGEKSELYERLSAQAKQTGAIYDKYVYGDNELVWKRDPFHIIFVVLDELVEKPYRLPDECDRLVHLLHRVLIFAHETFSPFHRDRIVKSAIKNAKAAEKAARSDKCREAVKSRGDQKTKSAFMTWAKAAVKNGNAPNTVNDLQALEGFKSEWSQQSEITLKKWAKEAGFVFKTGRPKKNKWVQTR